MSDGPAPKRRWLRWANLPWVVAGVVLGHLLARGILAMW